MDEDISVTKRAPSKQEILAMMERVLREILPDMVRNVCRQELQTMLRAYYVNPIDYL